MATPRRCALSRARILMRASGMTGAAGWGSVVAGAEGDGWWTLPFIVVVGAVGDGHRR
jgi:fatty acid desaturase